MMFIDVGINIEVVVGNRYRIMVVFCFVGLVFEGGEVIYGMFGYEGVVESVEI